MSPWSALAACGRMAVGVVLLVAAGLKLGNPPRGVGDPGGVESFAAAIDEQAIVPGGLSTALAWTTVGVELGLAAWLLSHWHARRASWAALVLLVVFAGYLLVVKWFGESTVCGCFGSVGEGDIDVALARNALLALALAPSVLGRAGLGPAGRVAPA